MRLTLIRHGQTHGNVAGALDTKFPGADLTELGQTQAVALIEELGTETFDSIWVSNLVRTQQTAGPLASHLGLTPEVREGLREIDAGALEGLNDRDSIESYINTVVSWMKGERDEVLADGVSGAQVLERFDDVVREIEATGHENVAIVAHGAVISYWTGVRTHDFPYDLYPDKRLNNTDVVVLEGNLEDGYALKRWADLRF